MTGSTDLAQLTLMYFIIPMWIAAGFADWIFHKISDIEHTAGIKESLIHFLMFAEVGVPLLAALFLEINALMIGVMILAFFIHEATALWDVSYAVSKRRVGPLEQHVHSFLEMLPLMAICIVGLAHPSQLMALAGLGADEASFALAFKSTPLPSSYIIGFTGSAAVFTVAPYLNELWRCHRAAQQKAVRP